MGAASATGTDEIVDGVVVSTDVDTAGNTLVVAPGASLAATASVARASLAAASSTAFSVDEQAVAAKYIHTPAAPRRNTRLARRSLRMNAMPLLLSPMQRHLRRLVALCAVASVTFAAACTNGNDSAAIDAEPVATASPPASSVGTDAPLLIDSDDVELPILPPRTPALPARTVGADGVEVVVNDTSRIVVLNGAIAEIVVSLGFADSIVGRDGTTVLPALQNVTKVSNGHDITTESILSLSPTVVIGDTRSGPPESIEQLRSAGVALLVTPEAWTLSAMPARVTMIAEALGVPESGRALNDATDAAVVAALRNTRALPVAPRVAFLYVRGTASVYLLGGGGTSADELIAAVGGIDVGKERGLGNYTPLTSEALVSANPDVLLVMSNGLSSVGDLDGLLSLPGIAETDAARRRAVVAVDDDLLLSFGPRTAALIARLSEAFAAVVRQ